MLRFMVAAAAVLLPTPLAAAWHKAQSPHFIIYSQENPAALAAFATRLERFDGAVRAARGMKDPPVGDGNRLTIFVVPTVSDVHELQRGTDKATAGFYMPRSSGSIAIVPRSAGTRHDIDPEIVFQHEYAHHLMFSDLATAYPTWLVEGFAEFYSTANVGPDGSVGLGEAPVHRKATLYMRRLSFPIESLLSGETENRVERAALYARGWLLTHYLTFAPKRQGQLAAYLAEIGRGRDSLGAARAAFGDLRQLERELESYLNAEKFPYLELPPAIAAAPAVKVERLGPGAEAVLPLYMRLQARTEANAAARAAEVRALAAAHPADPLVAVAQAEAEWVARDYRAAEAAADRAVALDPKSSEALIWKGRALLARADAKEPGVTFANARGWFNRANRLDPENPEPLLYFYRTFTAEGKQPTANAIAALHYAAQLAPQDMGLRLQSARQYLADGKPVEARRQLVPVAYNPHGGKLAREAQAMLDKIAAR